MTTRTAPATTKPGYSLRLAAEARAALAHLTGILQTERRARVTLSEAAEIAIREAIESRSTTGRSRKS